VLPQVVISHSPLLPNHRHKEIPTVFPGSVSKAMPTGSTNVNDDDSHRPPPREDDDDGDDIDEDDDDDDGDDIDEDEDEDDDDDDDIDEDDEDDDEAMVDEASLGQGSSPRRLVAAPTCVDEGGMSAAPALQQVQVGPTRGILTRLSWSAFFSLKAIRATCIHNI
jgi:hypothetical protein